MPLQNRVTPYGTLIATSAKGLFMGNRGVIHDKVGKLKDKHWQVKRWVTCDPNCDGQKRDPYNRQPKCYTELFFLDEATALAAGHRPCKQCRIDDFKAFVHAWCPGNGVQEDTFKVETLDNYLHDSRIDAEDKKITYQINCNDLPDGVFIELLDEPGTAWLLWNSEILQWRPEGYGERRPKPLNTVVVVLTPKSTVKAFDAGYRTSVRLQALQIHPEAARIIEEVRLLRDQLARLLQEREDLTSIVIPNLEAHYYVTIGKYQYELFCLECEVRRIKRKIEMIQASLNRMEEVNMDQIEKALDTEQVAWTKLIDDMAHKLEMAKQWTSAERLSDDEQKELKKLYYELAKKAHPDIHLEQSERLNSIWLQIVSAYQCGNLEGMRALALLLDDCCDATEPPAAAVLEDQHNRLKKQLELIAQVLTTIQQSFPCTIKDQINDQNWIDTQVSDIQEKQTQQSQLKEQLLIILAGIISGLAHDNQSHSH